MTPTRRRILGTAATGIAASLAGCGSNSAASREAWTYGNPRSAHLPVADRVHVYEGAASPTGGGYLWVLDVATGEVIEEVGGFGTAARFLGDGERTYHAGNARLFARNPDGSEQWFQSLSDQRQDISLDGEVVDMALAGGTLLLLQVGPRLSVFGAADGSLRRSVVKDEWESVVDLIANGMVDGDETGFVVVHTERGENQNGAFFAYDLQGREQWTTSVPWQVDQALDGGVAVTRNHIVVVGGESIHVHGRSGAHRWSKEFDDLTGGDVGVGSDHVYVLEPAGPLTAYAAEDGSEQWSYDPAAVSWDSLAIGDGDVYATSKYDTHALTTDGQKQWQASAVSGALTLDQEYVFVEGEELVALQRG